MYFDSHCHLDHIDLSEFNNDFNELLSRIRENRVDEMLCIGINLESFEEMYQLVRDRPGIYATVGVHPGYEKVTEPEVDQLVELAQQDKIVAIGETGLDYYHTDGPQWQRNRFRTHIEAAIAANKPLVIHTREAKKDTIQIMQDHDAQRVGGVMHCFTEDWEMAKQALDMGFYISISGIVTFKQGENVREVARKVPADRLLIETDSPWLAPVPYRGKTNFPGHVRFVAEKVAEVRQTDLETIASQTTRNARKLFSI